MNKISLKEKVIADAKKQLEKNKGSGSWLNRGVNFNHGLRLVNQDKKIKEILDICNISKREENHNNIEILIANLIYQGNKKPIIISMNNSEWKLSRYSQAGEGTTKLVNKLYDNNYIEMKIGYRTDEESRKTRIWSTEKLLKYFPDYNNAVIHNPVELVELRDEHGKLKDYIDTQNTIRIRTILERVNKINQLSEIKYGRRFLSASLVAIYKRKFTLNGRLHTKGFSHYQGLSSNERQEITINNNEVIELDFSGLHPHLLYAKEGIQFNGDPYSIVDERIEVREFLKHILLCMLNSIESEAEKAANHWLYKNHNQRKYLKEIGITKARPFIIAFRKVHKEIEKYFCSGKETGLRIMNLDAKIALEIIKHFSMKKICILAVHDSFIVEKKYEDELRKVMSQSYKKFTGGFNCPIK